MVRCTNCGRESPDDFEFCPACGRPLGAEPRQVRKFVTVLFCDLTGSTALGDRTDPEALRTLMRRYYDNARAVLERHGGTVEKFVGDAVMAVFGIPISTENDALRAVRAAVELRDAVQGLGLEARIGVNTGDVVAGEGDTLVTGDAVNVAARLEQSAAAGDVLLGEATAALVRDAVTTEAVDLSLRGKAGTVRAFRLLTLDSAASGVARHLDRRMVGRKRELERLAADFGDAAASRTTRLFTLLGPAGVGKSRLVTDFLAQVTDSATIAHGRALSYGDGITYWPLVEMLVQLGIEPARAICSSPGDTQLATRGLLEEVANEDPLILVIDDLQWAEPPMLDLIEHIADWSRSVPMFLLCIARPEVLDHRPGWGGGKFNATSVLLEPLGRGEAEELVDELLADLAVDAETKQNMLTISEGNPLFLEEMAALVRDAGEAVRVPPTIRALLQARLDLLNEAERTVIERGAVEGKIFHRGSVTALAPEAARDGVPGQLVALVRKELVRPDQSQIVGDDAYRFRHLLIRDTAYDALPKAVRAELHERFAVWIEAQGPMPEQEEIVGYHLEHAARYLRELGSDAARADRLAARAGSKLGEAGLAAAARGDLHAVCNLLGRAVALLPAGPQRNSAIPDLAEALYQGGRLAEMRDVIEGLEHSPEASDQATALVLRVMNEPVAATGSITATREALEWARTQLSPADAVAQARYERARAAFTWFMGDMVEAHAALRRVYDLARSVGRPSMIRDLLWQLFGSAWFAGASATEILDLLDDAEQWVGANAGPLLMTGLEHSRGVVEYNAGRISAEQHRSQSHRYQELLRQTGSHMEAIGVTVGLTHVAWMEGDLAGQERLQREVLAEYDRIGDRIYSVFVLASFALTKSRRGDPDGALAMLTRGRAIGDPEDVADQIMLDLAEAHVRGRHGQQRRARASLESARRRLAGTRMNEVSDLVGMVGGELEMMAGHRDRAMQLTNPIAEAARDLGYPRYADAVVRTVRAAE